MAASNFFPSKRSHYIKLHWVEMTSTLWHILFAKVMKSSTKLLGDP